jgi:hypothetical protein
MLEERVDIVRMSPSNHLLSGQSADEAYALASESQYAVYFTGKGDRTVTLKRSSSKSIKLVWLNPDTGKLDSPITVTGTLITLKAPGFGKHVAIISGDFAPPPPPPGYLSDYASPEQAKVPVNRISGWSNNACMTLSEDYKLYLNIYLQNLPYTGDQRMASSGKQPKYHCRM